MARATHFQRIEAVVRRGRTRYMVVHGALLWGSITAIVSALLMGAFNGWDSFPRTLGFSLLIYPLVGLAWGAVMFSVIQRYYQRMRSGSS